MALTKTPIELSSTPGIVDNSNATAITIDASENVLVGKTSAGGVATVGAEFRGSDGYVIGTASSDKSGWFGRNTSDGDIVGFYKDGTAVGSIGVEASDNFYIADAATNTGLNFKGFINPANSNGTTRDAAIDLGNSGGRFKDIYLSGGAYLGGTAAANKLEDYEEGDFTPTVTTSSGSISYQAQQGVYIKVGDVVHYWIRVSATCTTTAILYNLTLPFSTSGYNALYMGPTVGNAYNITLGSGGTVLGGYYMNGTNAIRFHSYGSNTGQLSPGCTANQGFEVRLEGSYRLSS